MLVLPCLVADCAWLYMVTVSLLAGSEPAVRPVSHFGMDIEDAKQYPWRLAGSGVGADLYSGTTSAVATRRNRT